MYRLFENINKYGKGNNTPFFLEVFEGSAIRCDRIGRDAIYSKDSFLSIIGTIQPKVFIKISEGMLNNGFLDRFLIIHTSSDVIPHLTPFELSPEIYENWESVINLIIKNDLPKDFTFSPEAKCLYSKWHYKITNHCNEAKNEIISGLYAKIKKYVLKLALILHIIRRLNSGTISSIIDEQTMKEAIKLGNYFYRNAFNFHVGARRVTVLDSLNEKQKHFYNAMPNCNFQTFQAKDIAKENGICSESSVDRYLTNKELFTGNGLGTWRKNEFL